MSTPVPSLPTALPVVEAASAPGRSARRALLATPDDLPALPPEWVESHEATAKAGEVLPGPVDVDWVVGVGDGTEADYLSAGAALVRAAETDAIAIDVPPGAEPDVLAAFTRGLLLGGYRYRVTSEEPPARLRTARLVVSDADRRARIADAVARASVLAAATAFTRDLANTPSNVKDPNWLARTGARAAGKVSGLDAVVRDEKWLAANGFGGVLAVGGGSARPPRLLHLTWSPVDTGPHLVLVGKGITFDTGGISVKPADGMHLMRTDMAGGGAVISAVIAIARLGLPIRVTGLVPCAENHISGSSYRPGDIVRHYGGRTTEVDNTDAEGRMVLADAMAYAVDTLAPTHLVDVATLTGAMKVSLGLRTGGLFGTDDALVGAIRDAGARAGEAWWRMPLLAEYEDVVRSDIADARQCPPGPGGVTAALFLREFSGGLPWAHLDIAGPARADKVYGDVVPGASGFAARTLVELAAGFAG